MPFNKTYWVFLFPLLLIVLTGIIFGFYYGEHNDILFVIHWRALVTQEAFRDLFVHHRFVSYIYAYLYTKAPLVPWYGISMYAHIYLATVCVFFFMNRQLQRLGVKPVVIAVVFAVFYLVMWLENVYLINFTRVGFLLMAGSMLGLIEVTTRPEESSAKHYAFFIICFVFGLVIRPELIVHPFILMLGIFVLNFLRPGFGIQPSVKALAPVVLIFGVYLLLNSFKSEDKKAFDARTLPLWNILDGNNIKDPEKLLAVREDSIKLFAMVAWYTEDTEMIDEEFIDRIADGSPFSLRHIKKWKNNLHEEYHKAKTFYQVYQKRLNWFPKFIGYNLMAILLLISSIFLKIPAPEKRDLFIRMLLLYLGYSAIILIPTVILKMEDKVFTPCSIMYLLLSGAMLLNVLRTNDLSLKLPAWLKYSLMVVFAVLMIVRVTEYWQLSSLKKSEVELKREFRKELTSTFSNKTILFDLGTLGLLHDTPLREARLENNNQYLVWGEVWSNTQQTHRNYLKEICGSEKLIDFYDYLYDKKEEVRFVYLDGRAGFLTAYFDILYKADFRFEPTDDLPVMQDIKYSFFLEDQPWHVFEFGEK